MAFGLLCCVKPLLLCKIGAMVKIGRMVFVLLFLMLLNIQLSGLSCLDDWTVQLQKDNTVSQGASTYDDECPCHFTFVSSPSLNVRWVSQATRVVTHSLTTYDFDSRFLLFRPPALA